MVAGVVRAEAPGGIAHVALDLVDQRLDPTHLLSQQAREQAAPASAPDPGSCLSAHVRAVSAAAGRSLSALS
jgi:hypothetical protein